MDQRLFPGCLELRGHYISISGSSMNCLFNIDLVHKGLGWACGGFGKLRGTLPIRMKGSYGSRSTFLCWDPLC